MSQPRRAGGGFTLVELLVVISIILLLVMLVLPAVDRARMLGMRALCRNNVREIARACVGYANEPRMHRGSEYGKALPCWQPVTTAANNAASLWLLVKDEIEMLGRDTFICPEAKIRCKHKVAAADATAFNDGGETTLSYSYLSQKAIDDVPVTSLLNPELSKSLPIVADKNPGPEATGNSLNHRGEGQNVGFIDGSAKWTNRRTISGDDIYESSGTPPARGGLNDAYLIP